MMANKPFIWIYIIVQAHEPVYLWSLYMMCVLFHKHFNYRFGLLSLITYLHIVEAFVTRLFERFGFVFLQAVHVLDYLLLIYIMHTVIFQLKFIMQGCYFQINYLKITACEWVKKKVIMHIEIYFLIFAMDSRWEALSLKVNFE